jgi:polar amino acid transport system permease protein
MEWDWAFAKSILPTLAKGAVVTIEATLLGSIVAMILGLVFAILRRSPARWLAEATGFLVGFVRGTPLLVQLYLLFYVLPDFGIFLSPLAAGVVGLGIHYASYTSEVYRAGIDNVARGQWEAATAVNLTTWQRWRHVIIPQAVPPMLPVLANYFIAMFKETPLLSAITVVELMSRARGVANFYYRYLEPMTMVGIFFLVLSVPSALGLRWLERRFSERRRGL